MTTKLPKIADTKPMAVDLIKGEEKYFCACGESKQQPFCDGSHKNTEFKPLRFTASETETFYLCMCKQTKTPPVAVSNSALQSIGCVAARMCNTNNCPAGIATQKPELRKLLNVEKSANQLFNFFSASTELMKVMARACGHDHLNEFNINDLTTWKKDMADLTGIDFGGIR